MFLQRLKIVLTFVLVIGGLVLIMSLWNWAMNAFSLFTKIGHFVTAIPPWIVYAFAFIMAAYFVIRFIYWLFIQPFRKKNKEKEGDHLG